MLKEFKEFAMRGNVMDMAVGIIIGAAFGKIVTSLVNDILMPPIGFIMGNVDFSDLFLCLSGERCAGVESLEAAERAGVASLNYGVSINTVLDFVIVAFAIFLLIRTINRMKRKAEAAADVPPPPSSQEKLLAEIRDLLKGEGAAERALPKPAAAD
jgi:large conductance mechanosensitive channel